MSGALRAPSPTTEQNRLMTSASGMILRFMLLLYRQRLDKLQAAVAGGFAGAGLAISHDVWDTADGFAGKPEWKNSEQCGCG